MRLIDADDLIKELKESKETFVGSIDEVYWHDNAVDYAISAIENAPTVEPAILHCNVKENAEIIARILDADVDGDKYFCIEPDGALLINLPIDTEKVKRIDLLNSTTHIGSLRYPE